MDRATAVACPRQRRNGQPVCKGVLIYRADAGRYYCGTCSRTFSAGEYRALLRMTARARRSKPAPEKQLALFDEAERPHT